MNNLLEKNAPKPLSLKRLIESIITYDKQKEFSPREDHCEFYQIFKEGIYQLHFLPFSFRE